MPKRDRREKFIELAEKRVNKAIQSIRLIGNLSDRRNYDYSEADVRRIRSALDAELRAAFSRFEQSQKKTSQEFKLK